MPKAAGHVGSLKSDLDRLDVIDRSLARIQSRIERDLSQVERAVSTLFDRELEPTEVLEALELCDSLGVKFGMLGFGVSAELLRRTAVMLDSDELGVSSSVAMASMLEDARLAMVSSIEDARLLGRPGPALTLVGRESETLDDLVWVAASQGLPVNHVVGGMPSDGQDVAAIILVADDPDLSVNRPVLRGLRELCPVEAVIVVTPPGTLEERASIVDLVTTIMPRSLPPSEVIMETRRAIVRASYERTVSVLGEHADWVADELNGSGLVARAESSSEDLLMSLQSGVSRAALLLPSDKSLESAMLLRAIRSDRTLRPASVLVVSERSDDATRHQILRDGADGVFSADADLAEVVVALKAALSRRADLEPVTDPDARHGAVPWVNAAVLIERLLTVAFRRSAPMGLAMLRLPHDAGPDDLDEQIAREFRRDDVIARRGDDTLVVALQGVGRRTLLKRVEDLHRKYGLDELGVRSAGVEFPVDGRSLTELVQVAGETLDRVAALGGPRLVGADWVPDAEQAVDILIVDPDETLGAVLTPLLHRKGFRAEHQPDALIALDHLTGMSRRPLPGLVLLELDLIGIDGLQFLRQLREAGTLSRFDVIIMTARTSEADLRRAFELGAEDFVGKPFSTPLLLHRVSRTLGRP